MTIKNTVIIFMYCGDRLLMNHESISGDDSLDLFGVVITDGQNPHDAMQEYIRGITGVEVQFEPLGIIEDIIHKPDGDVKLTSHVFAAHVDYELHVPGGGWYAGAELLTDPRVRRTKPILEAYIDAKPKNILMEENQLGAWLDAELIKLEISTGA